MSGAGVTGPISIVKWLRSSSVMIGEVRCAYENLGDILVHRAIERLMKGIRIITYDDSDRALRWLVSRKLFRFGMLGGGTLIFSPRNVGWLGSLESLLARTEPLCTFGTGVVDPEFVAGVYEAAGRRSPVNEESLQAWTALLRRFPIVGVRGVESARILRERGVVDVDVVGDPAVAFARDEVRPKVRRKRIGLNVLSESHFWPGSKERALKEMDRFARDLVSDGWEVHLMPACAKDLALAIEFADAVGRDKIRLCSVYDDVDVYMANMGALDLFVGMRLHSYVVACCMHTPGLVVGYQPKCLDFAKTIGLERYHIATHEVAADRLMAEVRDLYSALEMVQNEVAAKCSAMKQGLEAFAGRVAARLTS